MIKLLYFTAMICLLLAVIWLIHAIETRTKTVQHLSALAAIGNNQAPRIINEFITFTRAYRHELDVIYEYQVNGNELPFDALDYYSFHQQNFNNIICQSADIKSIILDQGGRLILMYVNDEGEKIKAFNFAQQHCHSN